MIVGGAICLVNASIGSLSALWAFDKPHAVFLKTLFGGMFVRMAGIAIVLIVLLRYTTMEPASLVFSLVGFFVIYQILEIRFLNTELKRKLKAQGA